MLFKTACCSASTRVWPLVGSIFRRMSAGISQTGVLKMLSFINATASAWRALESGVKRHALGRSDLGHAVVTADDVGHVADLEPGLAPNGVVHVLELVVILAGFEDGAGEHRHDPLQVLIAEG